MKLISSRDAVKFLSQAAPTPWVHRLLRWMAFDEGLRAYATSGRIQAHTSAGSFTNALYKTAGEFSGPKMDEAIREAFDAELADKLVGKDTYDRVNDEIVTWDDPGDPRDLDSGYFLYASEIDWDLGTIKCEDIPTSGEMADAFFPSDESFYSEFPQVVYDTEISGLSFGFQSIELLLPHYDLRGSIGFNFESLEVRRNIGRPAKWDWEGAMAAVVAQAQTPDGLPTGAGAQARIEEMIAEWFMAENGDSPASSQVRQRAAKIIKMLERSKTPKEA